METPPIPEKKINKYEFFKTKTSRENLFKASAGIAEYARENKVANILMLDRNARLAYIGVKKYFEHEYPNEKVPNIYFINPKGTKAIENMTDEEIEEIIEHCKRQNESEETRENIRNKEEISSDFKETYKELAKEKDQPILVFDTCSHTGNSLKHIKNLLENEDFQQINFLTFNPPNKESAINCDSIQPDEHNCDVFRDEKMIEKTFKSVLSNKSSNKEDIERSTKLRKEISKIIEDFLTKKENPNYTEQDKVADAEIFKTQIKNREQKESLDKEIKELKIQKSKLYAEQERYLTEPAKRFHIDNTLEKVEKEIKDKTNKLKELEELS